LFALACSRNARSQNLYPICQINELQMGTLWWKWVFKKCCATNFYIKSSSSNTNTYCHLSIIESRFLDSKQK
jgi:hypothetical protein